MLLFPWYQAWNANLHTVAQAIRIAHIVELYNVWPQFLVTVIGS